MSVYVSVGMGCGDWGINRMNMTNVQQATDAMVSGGLVLL